MTYSRTVLFQGLFINRLFQNSLRLKPGLIYRKLRDRPIHINIDIKVKRGRLAYALFHTFLACPMCSCVQALDIFHVQMTLIIIIMNRQIDSSINRNIHAQVRNILSVRNDSSPFLYV